MTKFETFLMVALLALAAQASSAKGAGGPDGCGSPDRCAGCGCQAACREKVCQVVCEIKKEKKTSWCVECEEICPLMPGRRLHGDCGGESCQACDGGGCDTCRAASPPPRCGHPRTVKKLVKKEYEVSVPVYRCVVRYLCTACESQGSPGPAVPAASAPQLPRVPHALKLNQSDLAPPAPLPRR